jgi:hypothetical protein
MGEQIEGVNISYQDFDFSALQHIVIYLLLSSLGTSFILEFDK